MTASKLERELRSTRTNGYAISREEWREGICAVASPVRNHAGAVIAALTVTGPASRLDRRVLRSYGALVRSTAGEVSRSLGYRG